MRHLKRQAVPKSWPITRKGTKFVIRSNYNLEKGIPVLIILRDMLKVAQNRKEAKRAITAENILLNGKPVRDDKNPAMFYDIITVTPLNKNYRIELTKNGKFKAEEISEKNTGRKISKVIGKKVLKNKKIQINFIDGRNFISNEKCKTGDSAVINFRDKKIEKFLPLKEKAKVIVFAGKHSGKTGEIETINNERKIASLNSEDGKINVLLKQLMVVE